MEKCESYSKTVSPSNLNKAFNAVVRILSKDGEAHEQKVILSSFECK